MRDLANSVVSAGLYSLLNLSIEGAIHAPITGAALAAKTTATLVNTWIISPAAWFILGVSAQATTYVVKKTVNGAYHLFTPQQQEPLLMIEDRKDRPAPAQ